MPWDSVPWAVRNGTTSPELGRLLAHVAFNGNAGIVGAADLKVSQLATPGAAVLVAPGACAIPCRAAGQAYQAYAGRMATQDQADVTAVGAGGSRSDMVVARVEDPTLSGEPWQTPIDIPNGPYIFTRVLANVGAAAVASHKAATDYLAAQGMSAIPLAGITRAASATTVLQANLVDLRRIANARRDRQMFTVNPGAVANLTSATYGNWFGSWQVEIPVWAVRAVVAVNIGGVRLDRTSTSASGTANGAVRVQLGTLLTQAAAYDFETTPSNAVGRYTVAAGDTLAIPAGDRGQVRTLTIQGNKAGGNKNVYADTATFATVDIEFQEAAA